MARGTVISMRWENPAGKPPGTVNVYDRDGVKIAEVVLTPQCVHEEELMGSDFVRLSWVDERRYDLPVGSYIVPFEWVLDISGEPARFVLLRSYQPQRTSGGYRYEPEFQHPKMWLGYVPMVFSTTDASGRAVKQTEYPYVGSIKALLVEVCDYINEQFGMAKAGCLATEMSDERRAASTSLLVYPVGIDVEQTVSITFKDMHVLDALSELSKVCGCEWHIDWQTRLLYFGVVRLGLTPYALSVDGNVGPASVSEGSDKVYNAWLVHGSSRNNTRRTEHGNTAVNQPLTLDEAAYPGSVIDMRPTDKDGRRTGPLLTEILTLDDVYPTYELYLYDLVERRKWKTDDDGRNTGESWSVWYVRLARNVGGEWVPYTLTTEGEGSMTVDGLVPTLAMQINTVSGAQVSLLGTREFEVEWHADEVRFGASDDMEEADDPISAGGSENRRAYRGANIGSGWFEIIHIEEGSDNLIIPMESGVAGNIIPQAPYGIGEEEIVLNNKCSIFNVAMDSTAKSEAQALLLIRAQEAIGDELADVNNYTLKSNEVAFEDDVPALYIGRRVSFDGGGMPLTTRVLKLTTRLDSLVLRSSTGVNHYGQEITVGNSIIKGMGERLRDELWQMQHDLDSWTTAIATGKEELVEVLQQIIQDRGPWEKGGKYYYETYNRETGKTETSRVWRWGLLWECRKSLTAEAPGYGATDWLLISDVSAELRITLKGNGTLAPGETDVVRIAVYYGSEDVTARFTDMSARRDDGDADFAAWHDDTGAQWRLPYADAFERGALASVDEAVFTVTASDGAGTVLEGTFAEKRASQSYKDFGAWQSGKTYRREYEHDGDLSARVIPAVWRYSIRWGSTKESTGEKPKYGCEDWVPIGGKAVWDVVIDAPGWVALNDVQAEADAHVLWGDEDVTAQLLDTAGAAFTWTRQSGEGGTATASDALWQPTLGTTEAGGVAKPAGNVLMIDHKADDALRRKDCGPDWMERQQVQFTVTVDIPGVTGIIEGSLVIL